MEVEIITSGNFKTNAWSGGTTTELFIFPASSDYKLRNFKFRLSTATVELEKSDFTRLPGVSRKLIILDSQITIKHEDRYLRQLKKFDVEEFEGDRITSSEGKCTDFNLMTTGNTNGKLSAILIEKNQVVTCNNCEKSDWFFAYVFNGKIRTVIDSQIVVISRGDMLVLQKPGSCKTEIEGVEKSELICTEIFLKN